MTNRWNLMQLKMGSAEPMRTDDFRRRSTGEKYWLLSPIVPFLIYGAILWGAMLATSIVLSPFSRLFRSSGRT